VLAAASLAGPLGDLADSLRARLPGHEVRLAFAGSHQIALQLEEGAPCDVVAMADSSWTGRLARAGRLQDPPILFATNSLVVAVPSSNPAGLTTPADLARPGLKIVLGTGESPIGRYARRVIARLALAAGSPPGFERRVLANVVSEEQDAGAIAAKLRLGEADAALLYRSDLPAGIAAIAIPDSLNESAIYAAGIFRDAADAGTARAFLDLLCSPAGVEALRRHGFGPPP
jgi:molybdate transport system substrate-binding protein